MATKYETSIITGIGRLSYAFLQEPREQKNGDLKYSTSFLIPKGDVQSLQRIQEAINQAVLKGQEKKWGGKIPKNLDIPLRDGDEDAEDKGEDYKGHYYINAKTDRAPGIVDVKRRPITDQDEVYSGCYGRLSITFFPFDADGNKGVGCILNNVQKVMDGEPLADIRKKAEDDFDDGFGEGDGNWGDADETNIGNPPPAKSGNGNTEDLPFPANNKRNVNSGDLPFGNNDKFKVA